MHVWNLSKTFTLPLDQEWDLLIKSSLGDKIHPDRIKGFLLSRLALKISLEELGLKPTPSLLELAKPSDIRAFPYLTISLSHTKEAGAALVSDRLSHRSVGIDLEHEERVVKQSVLERISHPEDVTLRNIDLWCLKEAAFKALMNSGNFERPIEFSSILIEESQWSHFPSGLEGKWELETITPFVVARAYLKS